MTRDELIDQYVDENESALLELQTRLEYMGVEGVSIKHIAVLCFQLHLVAVGITELMVKLQPILLDISSKLAELSKYCYDPEDFVLYEEPIIFYPARVNNTYFKKQDFIHKSKTKSINLARRMC